jgi:hypothetical protein
MWETSTEWLSCIKISMNLSKTDYMRVLESFCNDSQYNKFYIHKKFKLVGRLL